MQLPRKICIVHCKRASALLTCSKTDFETLYSDIICSVRAYRWDT